MLALTALYLCYEADSGRQGRQSSPLFVGSASRIRFVSLVSLLTDWVKR